MKKFLFMLFVAVAALVLVGCTTPEQPENPDDGGNGIKEEVSIVVPQGNPYIAVGNLVGEENIKIDSVNGAAGVKTALVGGEYDIVVAPLNLGAQLYVKGQSKYIIDSVIALGNTYIISNKDTKLDSLLDLEGKTILAYSQGGTPDIVLQYVLNANNVNVTIEYQPSLTEVVPFFVQGQYDYILAAEPVITNLKLKKNKELNVLNLQDYTDNTIMQAAIFVNPNSAKQESITAVIEKIKENINAMNNDPQAYSNSIIGKDVYFSDLGADIIAASLPNANLSYLSAKTNKSKIENYLTMIGYQLPNESFYK